MKTLREYIDQLDEISRRDFLKGAGAAAVGAAVGQPKDAESARFYYKDPVTDKGSFAVTSSTFPGALFSTVEERQIIYANLQEATNWTPNNVKKGTLHYPVITSPAYILRFDTKPPMQGKGVVFTVPHRIDRSAKTYGIMLVQGSPQAYDRIMKEFEEADNTFLRLEIDRQPTTIVFPHDHNVPTAPDFRPLRETEPDAIKRIEELVKYK